MKHVLWCVVLFLVGYGNVLGWQEFLSTILRENGCVVSIADEETLSWQPIIGGVSVLLCYPCAWLVVSGVSRFGLRQWNRTEFLSTVFACLLGANLGALLRAMIIVKINLQEAFAEGEIHPVLDVMSFAISQWMIYGILAGLVMSIMVLVPLGLLGDSEN